MTKSEMMKKSHNTARNLMMIKAASTYRQALSEAMRRIWALAKASLVEAVEIARGLRAIYLNVPYGLKDRAKKSGAKWDADVRSWYIVAAVVPSALQQFRDDMHNARMLSGASWA